MVFKLNFLSDCRLTMSQASSILYSPATTCSKKWSKTLLTIQIIWNIGMNQESNLIKIPKAEFFSRPNVQPIVQFWPIAKNSASVISSARSYWTSAWIMSPTWLRYRRPNFVQGRMFSRMFSFGRLRKIQLRSYPLPYYIEHCHESKVQPD